jgi:hypothetical protein
MRVKINCTIPFPNFLPNTVERGNNVAAIPNSSMSESSCKAVFIKRATISNWIFSSITYVVPKSKFIDKPDK